MFSGPLSFALLFALTEIRILSSFPLTAPLALALPLQADGMPDELLEGQATPGDLL
jgi:hypothetical protein